MSPEIREKIHSAKDDIEVTKTSCGEHEGTKRKRDTPPRTPRTPRNNGVAPVLKALNNTTISK